MPGKCWADSPLFYSSLASLWAPEHYWKFSKLLYASFCRILWVWEGRCWIPQGTFIQKLNNRNVSVLALGVMSKQNQNFESFPLFRQPWDKLSHLGRVASRSQECSGFGCFLFSYFSTFFIAVSCDMEKPVSRERAAALWDVCVQPQSTRGAFYRSLQPGRMAFSWHAILVTGHLACRPGIFGSLCIAESPHPPNSHLYSSLSRWLPAERQLQCFVWPSGSL